MSRTRFDRAAKKQRKATENWGEDVWHKYARCFCCNTRFVVNNYADRKVRVSHLKIGGKIVCAWCRDRLGKEFVQMYLLMERVATQADSCGSEDNEDCRCNGHVAKRLLAKFAEARVKAR